MLCRNGLHEIDPDDPWRGKARERCRECYAAKITRHTELRTISGSRAADQAKYAARHPERKKAQFHKSNARRLLADPTYRQMRNDTRRLGISAAEWRRQVEQGIIQLTEA